MRNISDEELLSRVMAADDELLKCGVEPAQRSFEIIEKVMSSLGIHEFVVEGGDPDPLVRRISSTYRSLYRPSDLAAGGIHGGAFMFRDVFIRVSIPLIYGEARIEPHAFTDLSPIQRKWLESRPSDLRMFIDQFTDIFDFAGGIGPLADYKTPPQSALERFQLAALQLQAAAAIVCAAFNFRGAVQSALIAVELSLKAGLAAHGLSESEIRSHRHNLISAADAFCALSPNFDIARVRSVLRSFPSYVDNRYSPQQPGRVETGHIVMGAQFVAGEVMHQITAYSFREALPAFRQRTYPSL